MATYNIDKITLPNGDVCTLKNNGTVASCNTIVNSGPYMEPPGRFSGENLFPECWWINGTSNVLTYDLFNDDQVMEFTASGDIEFQLCKPYMYEGDIYKGWDALDWHDGDEGILSCDIKCSVPLKFRMGLAEINSTLGNLTAMQSTAAEAPTYNCTEWTRVYFPFTIPTGWDTRLTASTTTRIYLVFLGTLTTGQTMYFRNAMLSHGNTLAAYAPSSQDVFLIESPDYNLFGGIYDALGYRVPAIRFYEQNGYRQELSGAIVNTHRAISDDVSAPGRIQFRQYSWDSTNNKTLSTCEIYTFPTSADNMAENVTYNIITTKTPHAIPVETVTATAGTSVSINSQSVKRTGNVVAGYVRFTSSASIAPYAYVINSLPASAHGAVFTLFDQYNGQINNSNVCLYMDVGNAGLRVSAGNLTAGTYSIYFNYICS